MKTIYAITSGSYSDYKINALFSSKGKAEEFMAVMKDDTDADYNDIEEYELDPPTVDLLKRGYSVWRVRMLRDGEVECAEKTDNDNYAISNTGTHYIWERTKAPAYKGTGVPDALEVTVWAKTEQAAVKIANEKRAQIIAIGEWE